MLWSTARIVEHNRLKLVRLVAGLFERAGIAPGEGGVETLPRAVRSAILLVLRQVESATRRLVFVETRGLDIPAHVPPKKPVPLTKRGQAARTLAVAREASGSRRVPRFRLVDPRVSYPELYPHRRPPRSTFRRERRLERVLLFRMTSIDGGPPVEAWAEADPDILPDDPITAVAICRRLQAVHHALCDLPKQAKRMVREIAKREAAPPGWGSAPPLRLGPAPGHRKRPIHEVDEILKDCQWLARSPDHAPVGV